MKISQISITDTFGTKFCKFAPHSITRIAGPNGSGKSSILRALGKLFEGGHDPSVIRNGCEKSIVEIKLDDGTVITRTCAPKRKRKGEDPNPPVQYSTSVEIVDSNGTPRNAPQTFINELGEASAIDPAAILRIDATTAPGRKALAEVLLRIMPIRFEPDEILSAMEATIPGGAGARSWISRIDPSLVLPTVDAALDLDGLKAYHYKITEQRRRVGVTKDETDGTISRLQKSLPEEDGEARDYDAELDAATAEHGRLEKALLSKRGEVRTQKAHEAARLATVRSEAYGDIDRDIDAKIRELETERHNRKMEAVRAENAGLQDMERGASQVLEELEAEYGPLIETKAADVTRLKELIKQHQRAASLREELDLQLAAHRKASGQYAQLTEVLARIENLRRDKLDLLPVAGLEVSGESVLVDGVPWQNVNTARKVEVALLLCSLRAGKLGLLLLDDCEHLTPETLHALEQGIVAAGYQLIEAEVSAQCVCGHDHPRLGSGGVGQDCALCGCSAYSEAPLRIETYEPVAV